MAKRLIKIIGNFSVTEGYIGEREEVRCVNKINNDVTIRITNKYLNMEFIIVVCEAVASHFLIIHFTIFKMGQPVSVRK